MKTLRALALPLLSLALGACGGTDLGDAPYTLKMLRAWPGDPIHTDEMVIDASAKKLTRKLDQGAVREAPLTDAEIAEVTGAIEASDLEHAPATYACADCYDGIHYTAKLAVDGESHEVTWETGSGEPMELLALVAVVYRLAAEKLPSGT